MRAALTHSAVAQLVPLNRDMIIARGGITRIHDARELSLRIVQGPVWVTQDGRADDVVLETGQTLPIPSGKLTLASTCGSTSLALIRIEPDARSEFTPHSRLAERIRSWWTAFMLAK